METIFHLLIYLLDILVTTIVLGASLRYALKGYFKVPQHRLFRILTHPAWFACLVVMLPIVLGQFARSASSPLPWVEFGAVYHRVGFFAALISAELVLIADLWLLWIPGHLWALSHPEADKRLRLMARVINLLAGLLLTTAANPIYHLIRLIFYHLWPM